MENGHTNVVNIGTRSDVVCWFLVDLPRLGTRAAFQLKVLRPPTLFHFILRRCLPIALSTPSQLNTIKHRLHAASINRLHIHDTGAWFTTNFICRISWTGNRTPIPGDRTPAVRYQ